MAPHAEAWHRHPERSRGIWPRIILSTNRNQISLRGSSLRFVSPLRPAFGSPPVEMTIPPLRSPRHQPGSLRHLQQTAGNNRVGMTDLTAYRESRHCHPERSRGIYSDRSFCHRGHRENNSGRVGFNPPIEVRDIPKGHETLIS